MKPPSDSTKVIGDRDQSNWKVGKVVIWNNMGMCGPLGSFIVNFQ